MDNPNLVTVDAADGREPEAFWQTVQRRMGGEPLTHCLTCGSCAAGCLVREVDKNFNPRRLVYQVVLGMKDAILKAPEVPYACNLCSLCASTCPYGIDVGKLNLALREILVEEGIGPLPRHKGMQDDLAFATAADYTIALPDPATGRCERVFFPGCSLPAYSPALVMQTWAYLRARVPNTGILLRCCGSIAHDLGQHERFHELAAVLHAQMQALGATELITGCPDCYGTLENIAGELRIRNLWEVMEETGAPAPAAPANGETFTLHDSCKARRYPGFHSSVRSLIAGLEVQIEELAYNRELTRCCGQGGLGIALNPFRTINLTRLRVADAHYPMLTYCAACRETLAVHKPTLHLLDLMFNPNWQQDKSKPMKMPKVRRENQAELSRLLHEVTRPSAK